jgi:hypothetical protein
MYQRHQPLAADDKRPMMPYNPASPAHHTMGTDMTAGTLSGLTAEGAGDAAPAISPVTRDAAIARIDFARFANEQFFVYGWILGLAKSVQSASIQVGGLVIDVVAQATSVRRPDIAQHFSLDAKDDEHGFFALIDLPDKFALPTQLRLSITLSSGEKTETDWPLSGHGAVSPSDTEPYVTAFSALLPLLPRPAAKRLVQFATALGLPIAAEHLPTLPPPVRFVIDPCWVLEDRILFVSGWIFDPARDLTLAQLRVGGSVFNLLKNSLLIPRSEINADTTLYRRRDIPQNPGFILIEEIPPADREVSVARFTLTAGAETVHLTRPISGIPQDARRELLSLVSRIDAEAAVALIERLVPQRKGRSTRWLS